jgi:hypothetical protein
LPFAALRARIAAVIARLIDADLLGAAVFAALGHAVSFDTSLIGTAFVAWILVLRIHACIVFADLIRAALGTWRVGIDAFVIDADFVFAALGTWRVWIDARFVDADLIAGTVAIVSVALICVDRRFISASSEQQTSCRDYPSSFHDIPRKQVHRNRKDTNRVL